MLCSKLNSFGHSLSQISFFDSSSLSLYLSPSLHTFLVYLSPFVYSNHCNGMEDILNGQIELELRKEWRTPQKKRIRDDYRVCVCSMQYTHIHIKFEWTYWLFWHAFLSLTQLRFIHSKASLTHVNLRTLKLTNFRYLFVNSLVLVILKFDHLYSSNITLRIFEMDFNWEISHSEQSVKVEREGGGEGAGLPMHIRCG